MILCSKCNKRVAVIFITKMDGTKKTNEGFCVKCAREIGPPLDSAVNDMIKKLGITPEQIENMEDEFQNMVGEHGALFPVDGMSDETEDGGAPAIDMPRLFREAGLPAEGEEKAASVSPSADRMKKGEKKEPTAKKYKFLDTYCRNLTKAASEGRLDRIVGRENELQRVIQILCRRQKNNPCLIGEPGVGKTAIAEALAQRVAEKNVPYKLQSISLILPHLLQEHSSEDSSSRECSD